MTEPDYGGVARSVNTWWNLTTPQEPTTLTLKTLLDVWDKLSGQLRELTVDDALDDLLIKAGVADEKREKYLDRVNQYDQAEVDRCKAIIEKNFARVWETRQEGETERDLIDRTMGLIEVEVPFDFVQSFLKHYGSMVGNSGRNVGKLTGLSNC